MENSQFDDHICQPAVYKAVDRGDLTPFITIGSPPTLMPGIVSSRQPLVRDLFGTGVLNGDSLGWFINGMAWQYFSVGPQNLIHGVRPPSKWP